MGSRTENIAADRLAEDVERAREALLDTARQDPKRAWRASELKTRARNGWDPGAMSIAMAQLIDERRFIVGDRLTVRLAH